MYYLGLLSAHVIFIITWFAALFYLPRLFVYHRANANNEDVKNVLNLMARKLFYYIMTPSMVLVWFLGVNLVLEQPEAYRDAGWLHTKVFLVFILSLYHISLGYYRKRLQIDKCERSEKFFRIYNEVPSVILIVVICLVFFKPF